MSKFIDLTGRRFGRLIVIELDKEKTEENKHGRYWKCVCNCGNSVSVRQDGLKNGHANSCGCLKNEKTSQRSRIEYGEASFNQLYDHYKRGAISRKLEWNLSKEEFMILTKKECYYCGTGPKQKHGRPENYGYYIFNGIDRIDNSVGYNVENCVSCCGRCNEAKLNYNINDFLDKIEKIYENIFEK